MIDFKLPSLGADMDEGALVAWLIEPGDSVERGQIVAEVETDKGIIEVECWDDVVVDALLVEPSEERLSVGTVIARFRSSGEDIEVEEPVREVAVSPNGGRKDAIAVDELASVHATDEVRSPPAMTPPVRHLAHELGVDVDTVRATGVGGSVTRGDIHRVADAVLASPDRAKVSPRARRFAAERRIDLGAIAPQRSDEVITVADLGSFVAPVTVEEPSGPGRVGTVDKAQAMRDVIARSMQKSKREIPHYYLGTTIDMADAMRWLEDTNEERPITRRILPAVLLLKATAVALSEYPDLNGHWTDGAFHRSDAVHLGVAVSLRGGGLVAPAIHNANQLGLDEMMESLSDLVARARAGRLRGSEMTDPTATVTNLGDRGVEITYPVIVPPQVAIVAFGRIADEPVVVDRELAVHPVVHATLAADHRVTDGHTGGLLLLAVERLLQEPERL